MKIILHLSSNTLLNCSSAKTWTDENYPSLIIKYPPILLRPIKDFYMLQLQQLTTSYFYKSWRINVCCRLAIDIFAYRYYQWRTHCSSTRHDAHSQLQYKQTYRKNTKLSDTWNKSPKRATNAHWSPNMHSDLRRDAWNCKLINKWAISWDYGTFRPP